MLSMLAQTPEELRQRAESLCRRMGESGVTAEVVSTENPVGGGAVPTQTLHSFAVAVVPRDSAAALEAQLRQRPVPIIVRADPRPFESPHQQLPHRGLYGERVPRRLSGAWPLPQHSGH